MIVILILELTMVTIAFCAALWGVGAVIHLLSPDDRYSRLWRVLVALWLVNKATIFGYAARAMLTESFDLGTLAVLLVPFALIHLAMTATWLLQPQQAPLPPPPEVRR